MKTSDIRFMITLDDHNVPERIRWTAADAPGGAAGELQDTPAVALALWDEAQQGTMKIDLWTKEMPVGAMKRFMIEAIGSLAETLENATPAIRRMLVRRAAADIMKAADERTDALMAKSEIEIYAENIQ